MYKARTETKKISYGITCDKGDLCKMMASSKLDENIKETIGKFFNKRLPPE